MMIAAARAGSRLAVRLGVGLVALAVAAPTPGLALVQCAPELESEMRVAGFSETEIAEAESGAVVTRLRRLKEDNAAFVVGVARIAAPRSSLVQQLRLIGAPRWRPANARMLQAGRFGTPPRSEDLCPLFLEPADVRALKDCRVGDCDVQVSVRTMEEGHRIDWRSPGADGAAETLLKSTLLERMETYLREGAAGLPPYAEWRGPE